MFIWQLLHSLHDSVDAVSVAGSLSLTSRILASFCDSVVTLGSEQGSIQSAKENGEAKAEFATKKASPKAPAVRVNADISRLHWSRWGEPNQNKLNHFRALSARTSGHERETFPSAQRLPDAAMR